MHFMKNGKRDVKILYPTDILTAIHLKNCAVRSFRNSTRFETLDVKKPRVGIVGEILVKFLPAANNHLVELLETEGAEAVVPDLLDFLTLLLL